jgi:hypothetical protein
MEFARSLSTPEYQKIKELRAMAKWSSDAKESRMAIRELSMHGDEALPFLEEVLSVTAYEDIKAACVEAIKAIEQKSVKSEKR